MSSTYIEETSRYNALLALAEYMNIGEGDIGLVKGRFESFAEKTFRAIQDGKIPGVQFVTDKQEKK